MGTATSTVTVYNEAQLDQTVTSYIAQGFSVVNRTPTAATLFKKKEFSILWLVIGLVLCVFPLFIYLIIYAGQSDKMVVVQLVSAPVGQTAPDPARLSPDGRYWWDGQTWQPVVVASTPIRTSPPQEPAKLTDKVAEDHPIVPASDATASNVAAPAPGSVPGPDEDAPKLNAADESLRLPESPGQDHPT